MDLFQDHSFKSQYQKSRYKVKTWESEFRKVNGRNPTKVDIRAAAPYVRDAYKVYYKLKTRVLEDLAIPFTEEAENEGTFTETNDVPSERCNTVVEKSNANKLTRTVLSDIQNGKEITDDGPVKEYHIKEDCIKQNLDIKNGVWGSHLNKKQVNETNEKNKVILQKSSSANFAEKLFEGAKFSKRNPRKSLSVVRRSKKSNVSLSQESSVTSEKIPFAVTSLSQPLIEKNENSIKEEQLPAASLSKPFLEKHPKYNVGVSFHEDQNLVTNYKIVQKTASVNNHAISVIQKVLESGGQVVKCRKTVDEGWLERCSKLNSLENVCAKDNVSSNNSLNELQNTRSGHYGSETLEISSFVTSQNHNEGNSVNTSSLDSTAELTSTLVESDDDIIYSSDSERRTNVSENKIGNLGTTKRKFICISTRSSDSTTTETFSKKPRLESTGMLQNDSNLSCSSNERQELVSSTVSEMIDQASEMKCVSKTKRNVSQKLTKKEILIKKVSSGRANDNFVKINIKKKIYVRGKKSTCYSKYKKMLWKKTKKEAGYGGASGNNLLTCYHCGEVGHFARHCMSHKGDKLLPLDNEEEENESPFPTLEEAARMAAESSISKRASPLLSETNSNCTDEGKSTIPGKWIPTYVIESLNSEEVRDPAVQPLYQLNPDGSLIDTPEEVYEALQLFGYTSFRPGQKEAVMRVLSGLSTLVTLSTGSGKSLCYQLPAYLFSRKSKNITVVVSPLVSLMEDQVTGIPSCIQAACLHTNQTPKQREKVMEMARSGNLNVLLVSPEAVVSSESSKTFGSVLKELPPIAFACIDEAHCVSQWSHNFRPSYLMVCQILREKLGVKTILGLTATATKATCSSIVDHLTIPDGESGIIKDTPLPDNLLLSVSKDVYRDKALIALLCGSRFKNCQSIIIYCTRREECERLAVLIRTSLQDNKRPEKNRARNNVSWNAEAYHAGLSAARRKLVQKNFMAGQLRIVVATVAFGMGINKQDIRGVIHYNMPCNFESYVQEVGRAGRDGLPAHCHVFLDSQGNDQNELRRHIYANSIERHVIRKLLQRVFVPCKCKRLNEMLDGLDVSESNNVKELQQQKEAHVKCPGHEVAFSIDETVQALDLPRENIATLLCYLELHPKKWITCLHSVYTTCTIHNYKTPNTLKAAAKMSPPLATAIALDLRRGISHETSRKIEFPVVDIASTLGLDSGAVKSHLKDLEWHKVSDKWRRTGLRVEFSCLGFRVIAPGNLQPSELDEALDSLHDRVNNQEVACLQQLELAFDALSSVAYPSCFDCADDVDQSRSEHLKQEVRKYFQQETLVKVLHPQPLTCEEQVASDVRHLVCSYRDVTFTGRTVARIFHGIPSPCFPAQTWSRCRLWRSHLQEDFKLLIKVASREILQLR